MTSASTWQVDGWVMAPGEFPMMILHTVMVRAVTIEEATTAGQAKLLMNGIDPVVVVRIERISPPWRRVTT